MTQKEEGGGYQGPTPEEERASAEEYWNTYKGWEADATKRYEGDLARDRARNAASGGSGESAYAKGRKASYDKEIAGIQGGAHGQALTEYFEKIKGQKISAAKQKFAVERAPMTGNIVLPSDNDYTDPFGQKSSPQNYFGFTAVADQRRADEQKYVQQQGQLAAQATAKIESQSMDDFYKAEFGEYDGSAGPNEQSAIAQAQGRANRAASGGSPTRGSTASAASASGGGGSVGAEQKPLGLANWFA